MNITIENTNNIKEIITLAKEMAIVEINNEEVEEKIEFKFINLESLTINSWNKRYNGEESPVIELRKTTKYNKSYFILDIKYCIEEVEEINIVN